MNTGLDLEIEKGVADRILAAVDRVQFKLENHDDWLRVRKIVVSQVDRLDFMSRVIISIDPQKFVPFPTRRHEEQSARPA